MEENTLESQDFITEKQMPSFVAKYVDAAFRHLFDRHELKVTEGQNGPPFIFHETSTAPRLLPGLVPNVPNFT
jgi:hypothetical protein